MPTKYKDYPVYTYDEPAVYNSFIGGINTDPSNEHIGETEMRDCVNMHYLSGALVKRKGATKLCDISCEEDIDIVQGIFIFTNKLSYIILAADGKLFYGIYNEHTTIELTRLEIIKPKSRSEYENDETDPLSGLYDKQHLLTPSQADSIGKHDGYIQVYIEKNGIRYLKNDRTDEAITDIEELYEGDVIKYNNKEYLCIKYTVGVPNPESATEYLLEITDNTLIYYNLIFQNYRKVEAATINNKFYIATGTRIIEIALSNNVLEAHPVQPYLINDTEQTKIGYNYLSPYPELAVTSQYNTVTTSIFGIKVRKFKDERRFLLAPLMNIQVGDSYRNYRFKWEKYVNGRWYVIVPYYIQDNLEFVEGGLVVSSDNPYDYSVIEVDDADDPEDKGILYRCSFAKSFKSYPQAVKEWKSTKGYEVNDLVSVGQRVYKCVTAYQSGTYFTEGDQFSISKYDSEKEDYIYLFKEVYDEVMEEFMYKDSNGNIKTKYIKDYAVDEVDGEYFGSATSVKWNTHDVNDTFQVIQSCTKVIADGDKLLFYSDNYGTGQWFKTIIKNPCYITDRGGLSFKTTKNEEIVKVVPFQGNIIVFANSEAAGGSIHLVTGNGDDYNSGDGYYSPYQRKTINASISCNNADTIQICDNLLVFKFFNRVYYINASELNNEVVKVVPVNKRVMSQNSDVAIPWDDNDCISEVTDTYYALIWKEKYSRNSDGSLVQERPGIRVKMYYNMSTQYEDNSYGMPWLRDESDVFNSKFVLYVKGKPIYLYNNILVSFDEESYNDLGKEYSCIVHFRGEGLNYPQQYKLIEHIIVGFHRNQYNKIDLSVIIKNEAGHKLLDTDSNRFSINDLGALKVGDLMSNEKQRLGSTIQDMKLFNTVNMFPCLLADTYVEAKTKGSFALSSVTYAYTSTEQPETNPYDLYAKIIRPKEARK